MNALPRAWEGPLTGRIGGVDFAMVNGVFGDPLLHLRFRHLGRSLLFDIGDASRLWVRLAHQVSDVFVSHAHMDHLSGFLWLLRNRLGDFPACRFYGPPGLIGHLDCLIQGFLWDRIGDHGPAFEVNECHGETLQRARLQAGRPGPHPLEPRPIVNGILLDDHGFRIRAIELDHHTPVLAFALELERTVNIRKDRLRALGADPGPWLSELRRRVLNGEMDGTIRLPGGTSRPLAELVDELLLEHPGRRLVYATDLLDSEANRACLTAFARGAHTFFCEACFAAAETENAARNGHLTTHAASRIAAAAEVGRLYPFHFSRRYEGEAERLYEELREGFARVVGPGGAMQ